MDYFDRARGHLLFRHTESAYDPHLRMVCFGGEVAHDAENYRFLDSLKEGPWAGWMKLETKDNIAYPRLWVQSSPAIFTGKAPGLVQPSLSWTVANDFLKPVKGNTPFKQLYPGGYPAILLPDSSLEKQIDNVAALWAGLICPSEAGDLDYSSPVWAITDTNDIDRRAPAYISSSWYVYQRPASGIFGTKFSPTNNIRGLAWHTGLAGPDNTETISGLGMCIEKADNDILFAAGRSVGGMLHPGKFVDQHRIDETPDGIPINAQHVNTEMIWIRPDETGDGPQEDSGAWNPFESVGPLHVKTFWRFDPEVPHNWALGRGRGLWKWQTSSFFGIVPPPEDQPPPRRFPPPLLPPPPQDEFPPFVPLLPPPPPDTHQPWDPRNPSDNTEIFNEGLAASFDQRSLYGTPRELSFCATVGRATKFVGGLPDLRNKGGSLSEEDQKFWALQPSVIRRDYIGKTIGAEFQYTHEAGQGRYIAGGSASGAEVLMPPEIGIEFVNFDLDNMTYSETRHILGRVCLGLGTPIIEGEASGGIKDGFMLKLNPPQDALIIARADSAGTVIENTSINANGDFETARDIATGRAYKHVVRLVGPGTTVATIGDQIEVTTSAASTIQLPDPALYLGKRVSVKDGSGGAVAYPIAITTPLGGTIDGLTSSTININRASREFQSNGTDWKAVGFYDPTPSWAVSTAIFGTATAADGDFILVSASTCIITLPAPAANARVALKVLAATVTDIQLRTSGAGITIDGTDYSASGFALSAQWEQINVISDGVNWYFN